MAARGVPSGFEESRAGGCRLIFRSDLAARLRGAGLDRPWETVAERPPGGATGRGPRGVVDLGGGERVLVKQCLRGGLLANVNPSLYFSTSRFVDELRVGQAAAEAGCQVVPAVGTVLCRCGPGVRAWMMAPYLDRSSDLYEALLGAGPEESRAVFRQAMGVVAQAFGAGLHHRDLNLGNVLVRDPGEGRPREVFLVDLDRARWLERPLPPAVRRRVIERFDRSWRKLLGEDGVVESGARWKAYEGLL